MYAKHLLSTRGVPGLAELLDELIAIYSADRPDLAEKLDARLKELKWVLEDNRKEGK